MTLTDARSRTPTTARSPARCCRSGPATTAATARSGVVDMAGRLGIDTSKLSAYPSLTLGASSTNVLDMAEAYSVFANDGVHRTPTFVTKIEGPDGKVLYQADTAGQRVLARADRPDRDARCSRDVIKSGTGDRAPTSTGRPRARPAPPTTTATPGSSGTRRSTRPRCGWATGTAQVPMNNVGGIRVHGRHATRPQIWAAFMKPAHESLPVIDFTAPDEEQWPRAGTHRRVRPLGLRRARATDAADAARADGPDRARPTTTTAGRRSAGRTAGDPPDAGTARDRLHPTPPRRRRRECAVSADELERLLVVQEHDLALDRLRHRRASLPERARARGDRRSSSVRSTRELRATRRSSATPCSPRRSASTTKRRPSARTRPRSTRSSTRARSRSPRELQAMQADVEMLQAPPQRSRGSRARGDGAAGDARRARSPRPTASASSCGADVDAARSRRSPAPRPRSTPRSPTRPRRGRSRRGRIPDALLARLRAAPGAEPRRGRGAARRHDLSGLPPHDPVDRSGADPAGGGRAKSRTATTAAPSSSREPASLAVRADAGTDRLDRGRSSTATVARAGNPGPGGDRRGRARPVDRSADALATVSETIGVTTNNVAEYKALIAGLEAAAPVRARVVRVRADSLLMIRAARAASTECARPHLAPLHARGAASCCGPTTRSTSSTCGASRTSTPTRSSNAALDAARADDPLARRAVRSSASGTSSRAPASTSGSSRSVRSLPLADRRAVRRAVVRAHAAARRSCVLVVAMARDDGARPPACGAGAR